MSDEPNTNVFADEIFADKITATESIEVEQINSKKVVISGEIEAPGLMKSGEAIAPGTATSISSPQPDTLALGTNDEPRVTITGIGSVGIGTITPEAPVNIAEKCKVGIGTTRSVQVTQDGGIELVRYPKAEDWPATVTYSSYIDFKRVESDDFESRIQHIGTSGTHFGLRICTGIDNGFGTNEKLRIGEYGQIGITTDGYSGYNYGNKRQFLVSGGDGASIHEIGAGGTSVNWYSGINRPAFFAYNTGNKAINHNTETTMVFDFTDGNFGTTENIGSVPYDPSNGKFTVPEGEGGWYMITAQAGIDDLDSGKYLRIRMYINGLLDVVGSRSQNFSAAGNTIVTTNFSFIRGLGEADEITIKVFHNNGDTQNLEPLCSYFSAFKLNI